MITEPLQYTCDALTCHGHLAYDPEITSPLPAVLVVHAWGGQDAFARQKAEAMVALGYIGLAIDLYGEGRQGQSVEENKQLMQPLIDDRALLQRRILAALNAVRALPQVDASNIAAIGYCFGGLSVLDLARTGAAVQGVVSFHGLLSAPNVIHRVSDELSISAKILACHGYADPMVPPEQVNAFAEEMTTAGADWQCHLYGHAYHAFTNPEANDTHFGVLYDQQADERSWRLMVDFFKEIFKH